MLLIVFMYCVCSWLVPNVIWVSWVHPWF